MIPLVHVPSCTSAVILSLPKSHGLARRLISLGLTPGAEVRVLRNWGSGPVIVEVHGARIAVGRGQAARVAVGLLPDGVSDSAECEGAEDQVPAVPDWQ